MEKQADAFQARTQTKLLLTDTPMSAIVFLATEISSI